MTALDAGLRRILLLSAILHPALTSLLRAEVGCPYGRTPAEPNEAVGLVPAGEDVLVLTGSGALLRCSPVQKLCSPLLDEVSDFAVSPSAKKVVALRSQGHDRCADRYTVLDLETEETVALACPTEGAWMMPFWHSDERWGAVHHQPLKETDSDSLLEAKFHSIRVSEGGGACPSRPAENDRHVRALYGRPVFTGKGKLWAVHAAIRNGSGLPDPVDPLESRFGLLTGMDAASTGFTPHAQALAHARIVAAGRRWVLAAHFTQASSPRADQPGETGPHVRIVDLVTGSVREPEDWSEYVARIGLVLDVARTSAGQTYLGLERGTGCPVAAVTGQIHSVLSECKPRQEYDYGKHPVLMSGAIVGDHVLIGREDVIAVFDVSSGKRWDIRLTDSDPTKAR